MADGVRAEVEVVTPDDCELAGLGRDTTIRAVSRTPLPEEEAAVAEFVAEAPVEGAEKVFDYGSTAVYRLAHEDDRPCVCRRIERMGYPVRDHRVEAGTVTLAFFVPDIASLRSVVEELTGEGRRVSIRRLTRSGATADSELVFVDRSALTDRQLEVLRTADRMGYFEHPKEANAGDVADELGVAAATFAEHLSAAQRKLLDAVLD